MQSEVIKITLDGSGESTTKGNFFNGIVWAISVDKNGQAGDPTVVITDNKAQEILDITESGSGFTVYRPSTPLQTKAGVDRTQYGLFGVNSAITIVIASGTADAIVDIIIDYIPA